MKQKKKTKGNKLMRSNNILVYKLIDPIVQSLLFILFVYSLDTDATSGISYHMVLFLIIAGQVISSVINFIINEPKQLKTQRISYLVTIALYVIAYLYITANIKEKYVEVIGGSGPFKMPMVEIVTLSIGIIITFWYYVTCFREIRDLLSKAQLDEH